MEMCSFFTHSTRQTQTNEAMSLQDAQLLLIVGYANRFFGASLFAMTVASMCFSPLLISPLSEVFMSLHLFSKRHSLLTSTTETLESLGR